MQIHQKITMALFDAQSGNEWMDFSVNFKKYNGLDGPDTKIECREMNKQARVRYLGPTMRLSFFVFPAVCENAKEKGREVSTCLSAWSTFFFIGFVFDFFFLCLSLLFVFIIVHFLSLPSFCLFFLLSFFSCLPLTTLSHPLFFPPTPTHLTLTFLLLQTTLSNFRRTKHTLTPRILTSDPYTPLLIRSHNPRCLPHPFPLSLSASALPFSFPSLDPTDKRFTPPSFLNLLFNILFTPWQP